MYNQVNKKDYTIQDLINNQSFRRLINGEPTAREIKKWDDWVEASERNRMIAKKAMAEIAGFEFNDPSQPDIDAEWERLYRSTIGKAELPSSKMYSKGSSSKWPYRVVAILVLGALIGLGIYGYSGTRQQNAQIAKITKQKTIKTESREQKTINFSNGSKIVLNSNSSVTYSIAEKRGHTIDVVLEGEAYFDAEDGPNQAAPVFKVETPDGVVKDIGTKFLVSVERTRSRVVLQQGEVRVKTKNQEKSDSDISLKAGQMLEFNKTKVLRRKEVNSTFYTSWATGFMQFDQTTIKQFAGFVEQRFNVKVQIVDTKLSGIKIDGGIYYRSLEELVRSVTKVAGIPVYQSADRDTVFIGDKNQ